LTEFLATDEGKLSKAEWDAMPEDEKDMYREEIEALREGRQATVRQNPQATLVDVNHTFKAMDNEVCSYSDACVARADFAKWTAIENRTGGEGIYFFVRPNLDQVHAPKVHYTPAVENFFKDTFNVDPEELALRMESYLVRGRRLSSNGSPSACRD
jgi:predicted oxidoreductase (fatty acid repression mutant protein)